MKRGARYLRAGGDAERVMTVRADAGFFEMLGVPPLRGRTLDGNDTSAVAVISEGFWRQRLNADPSALGTTLTLDDQPVTIVGIMPASFQFPYGAASLLTGVAIRRPEPISGSDSSGTPGRSAALAASPAG